MTDTEHDKWFAEEYPDIWKNTKNGDYVAQVRHVQSSRAWDEATRRATAAPIDYRVTRRHIEPEEITVAMLPGGTRCVWEEGDQPIPLATFKRFREVLE